MFLISCSNSKKEECQFGAPTAIFNPEIENVVQHNFQATDQQSTEIIEFENELKVEIDQSGCNHIQQTYKFWIDRPGEGDPNWFFLAAEQFSYLSKVSSQTAMLGNWTDVIEANASQFKLSKPVEVESNFFVKIDKINEGKKVILIVELSQNLYAGNQQ